MMAVELTEKQEQFAAWLALRKGDRPEGQRSVEQMAKVLQVDDATLYRWKKLQSIKDRTYEILNEAVASPEMVGDLVRRLYEQGMGGDVKAITTFLQYAGVMVERKQVTVNDSDDVAEMSDEELLREADAFSSEAAQRFLNRVPGAKSADKS